MFIPTPRWLHGKWVRDQSFPKLVDQEKFSQAWRVCEIKAAGKRFIVGILFLKREIGKGYRVVFCRKQGAETAKQGVKIEN